MARNPTFVCLVLLLTAATADYALDGSRNKPGHPLLGSKMLPLKHRYGACFADGRSTPRFIRDLSNPNITNTTYDECVASCEQRVLVATGRFEWSYGTGRAVAVDPARPKACAYACNSLLSLNVRRISTKIFKHFSRRQRTNPRAINDLHSYFGDFILREMHSIRPSGESWPYPVPRCDPRFDRLCSGSKEAHYDRPLLDNETSTPVNHATPWVDGNFIYGGDVQELDGSLRLHILREGQRLPDGNFTSCKLRLIPKPDFSSVSEFDRYDVPVDEMGYPQFGQFGSSLGSDSLPLFLTANLEANVYPGTLAIVIVFMRLHNQYCEKHADKAPEEAFRLARRMVIAHQQKIFYHEFLPKAFDRPRFRYRGYKETEDPAFDLYLTQAAARTWVSDANEVITRLNSKWSSHELGHLTVGEALHNPGNALEAGLPALLRGLMTQDKGSTDTAMADAFVDGHFDGSSRRPVTEPSWTDQCRAQLGSGAALGDEIFDLQASIIQEGRDMGLCGINTVRKALKRKPIYSNWNELVMGEDWARLNDTEGRELAKDLEELYGPDPDSADFWVAGLAEIQSNRNTQGDTFRKILYNGYNRLRYADWWDFENEDNGLFTEQEVTNILLKPFSHIIQDTVGILGIEDQAFQVQTPQLFGGADFQAKQVTMPEHEGFDHSVMLNPSVKLSWSQVPEEDAMDFALSAATTGWLALGFGTEGKHPMKGTDMMVCHYIDGAWVVQDCYSVDLSQPTPDEERSPPGTSNLRNVKVVSEGGVNTFYVRRPIAATDSLWDATLNTSSGRLPVVWAFHQQGGTNLAYHGPTRGYSQVQIFTPECPVGNFLDTRSMICKPCAAGSFITADMPITACAECAVGRWSSEPGSSSCQFCPGTRTTQIIGATSVDFCMCPAGTFETGGVCRTCPRGLGCAGFGAPLVASPGYMTMQAPAAGRLLSEPAIPTVWRCYDQPIRCPGGVGEVESRCAEGREGLQCAACQPNRIAKSDGTCQPCGNQPWLLPVVLAAAVVLVLQLLGYHAISTEDRSKQKNSLLLIALAGGQTVTVFQIMGAFHVMSFGWPLPISTLLQAMTIFTFDLELLNISCMAEVGPVSLYILKLLVMGFLCLNFLVIHIAVVTVWHGRRFREQLYALIGTLGTVMLACFLAAMTTAIAPFACVGHPNGQSTVQKYPTVVCFDSQEHTIMLVFAVVGMTVPLAFLCFCTWILVEYPRRIAIMDIDFLRSYGFLFFRFRPGCHWFGLAFIVRNLLISLIPTIASIVVQTILMQLLLLSTILANVMLSPWRVPLANLADGFNMVCMLLLVSLAAFFVELEDTTTLAELLSGLLVAVIVILFLVMVVGTGRYVHQKREKPYQFFLSHHKAGAGALVRLMKLELQNMTRERKKVFVDSDNLSNLDMLFDIVGSQTQTLVAFCSQRFYVRPWCVGELATAMLNNVNCIKVDLPGFVPPDSDMVENYTKHVGDLSSLTERGITVEMMQQAITWTQARPRVFFPVELTEKTSVTLGMDLAATAAGQDVQGVMPQGDGVLESRAAILVDWDNLEAVASALVLQRLLLGHFTHAPEQMPKLLPRGMQPPERLQVAVVICSPKCFFKSDFQDLLMALGNVYAIPVIVHKDFHIPRKPELKKEREKEEKNGFGRTPISPEVSRAPTLPEMSRQASHKPLTDIERPDAEVLILAIQQVFTEIAINFEPNHASDSTLQSKVTELFRRLTAENRQRNLYRSDSWGTASKSTLASPRFQPEPAEERTVPPVLAAAAAAPKSYSSAWSLEMSKPPDMPRGLDGDLVTWESTGFSFRKPEGQPIPPNAFAEADVITITTNGASKAAPRFTGVPDVGIGSPESGRSPRGTR